MTNSKRSLTEEEIEKHLQKLEEFKENVKKKEYRKTIVPIRFVAGLVENGRKKSKT